MPGKHLVNFRNTNDFAFVVTFNRPRSKVHVGTVWASCTKKFEMKPPEPIKYADGIAIARPIQIFIPLGFSRPCIENPNFADFDEPNFTEFQKQYADYLAARMAEHSSHGPRGGIIHARQGSGL